jgi:hypothetical protein
VQPASRLDDASKCAQPALAKFYQSLNDEQKARIFASSWRLGDHTSTRARVMGSYWDYDD